MRRVFMMAFAIAVLGSVGVTTGAMASSKSPGCDNKYQGSSKDCRNDKRCDNKGKGNSKHDCKKPEKCDDDSYKDDHGDCKPKPKMCPQGQEKVNGKCVPKCKSDEMRDRYGKCVKKQPPACPPGQMRDSYGKCVPKQPPNCPPGTKPDNYGNCVPVPANNCAQADVVLLKDILGPTGPLPRLVCLYFGDNAPNADKMKDCPDADIALPIDSLIGACVFLSDPNGTATMPAAAAAAPTALPDLGAGSAGLGDVTSTVTSTLTSVLG